MFDWPVLFNMRIDIMIQSCPDYVSGHLFYMLWVLPWNLKK